jgi:YfiH family protein
MIRPPGFRGAVFGEAADGDPRTDPAARRRFADELGVPVRWSWANQVHGCTVLGVDGPGMAGDGDGLLTDSPGLALAVSTADCVPVIVEGEHSTVVVHAGWRGMAQEVVGEGVAEMVATGDRPLRAAIGPSIGPCCYEVGPEVIAAMEPHAATTSWGTPSIDLWAAAAAQLGDLHVWRSGVCTFTDHRFRSFRRDRTSSRQVSVTWLSPH